MGNLNGKAVLSSKQKLYTAQIGFGYISSKRNILYQGHISVGKFNSGSFFRGGAIRGKIDATVPVIFFLV